MPNFFRLITVGVLALLGQGLPTLNSQEGIGQESKLQQSMVPNTFQKGFQQN